MKRKRWIDTLRGIAIIAVVLDHVFYTYPQSFNHIISQHTYFSVTWFFFLSGAGNYYSFMREKIKFPISIIRYYAKRVKSLIIPYVVISVLYYCLTYGRKDLYDLLGLIINFKVEPLFYFVRALGELYLLFPLFFFIVFKKNIYLNLAFSILIYLLSFVFFPLVWPPWFYQTGKSLISIAYLLPFFLGMVFVSKAVRVNLFTRLIMILFFLFMESYYFITNGKFIGSIPNFYQTVWALSLFFAVYVFESSVPTGFFTKILGFLGKRSMPIFFLHFLFLLIVKQAPNIFQGRFLVITVTTMAIVFSLSLEFIYNLTISSITKHFLRYNKPV